MRFRLRTLMMLLAVGPPLLAAAWLWWWKFITDAFILLVCEFLATAMLLAVLAVVALIWAIAKGAVRLTCAVLRLTCHPHGLSAARMTPEK